MELDAFVYLLEEGLPGGAVAGMERGVVAVGASTGTNGAVAVRAAEAGIQDQLLQPFTIFPLEHASGGIVSPAFRKVHHKPCKTN